MLLDTLSDASSVNKTYLSNIHFAVPDDIQSYLTLNRSSKNKQIVAMKKILQHYSHFDMQPLFEWEFKALPLIIGWFEKAAAHTTDFDEKISKMKLACIYDFVREFPMLSIAPVTGQGAEDFSAKMQVQGKYQQSSCCTIL